MIEHGPDIPSQLENSVCKSDLAIAQLLMYNYHAKTPKVSEQQRHAHPSDDISGIERGYLILGNRPNSRQVSSLPDTYANVRPAYLKTKPKLPNRPDTILKLPDHDNLKESLQFEHRLLEDELIQQSAVLFKKKMAEVKIGDVEYLQIHNIIYEREAKAKCLEEKLIARTNEDDEIFIKTKSYEKSSNILQTNNLVIIVGSSGEGKSFIARRLVREKIKDGLEYREIMRTADWDQISYQKNQIVLMENAFQKKSCCRKPSADSYTLIATIQEHIEYFKKSESVLYVVITSRPDIFSELQKLFENRPFFDKLLTVDLNAIGLTFAEKVEIFRKHEQKCNGLKFDEKSVTSICKCDTPSFPNCVDIFFTNASAYKKGLDFFRNPTQFLNTEIKQIFRDDKALYTVMVLLAMNDGRLIKCNLLKTIKATNKDILKVLLDTCNADCPKQIKAVLLKVLEKSQSFLQQHNEFVIFRYRCISHAVCASFGEMMPEEALMYLPVEFIFQKVFVDESNHSKDEEGIVLPRNCQTYLAKRLIAELELGCIEQVCRHNAFSSPCFSCSFITVLKEKDKHQIRFVLQITERSQKNRALWNGSLLYWSAAVGEENLLLRLLMEDLYTDLQDNFFVRTQASAALQCACQRRFPKTVISKLIELHADVNTSLHLSKREQTYNCDHCNLQDQNGITPLQSSIFGFKEINIENVELILKSGVQFKENAVSYRPLIMAVQKRHVKLIELLLKYDIDINAFDNDLHSALYYCVEQDDVDILKLIMTKSKIQYKAHENLLIVCSSRQMATYLLDQNIDTNIKFKDENGKSILHYVRSKELVSFFIERGCTVDHIDELGQTPIFCARSSDILFFGLPSLFASNRQKGKKYSSLLY
ncbi:unnamed protein product [Mytilus coruscus]|uniref:Novel STAND NTPase 3 domain-containing protein n=1 Tax=Mytilus coruscus TaxID=42192 RepID=A0A6J7ZX18_MYTCO|nr:unnamed protein product [Mytilus coruscus]